MTMKNQNLTAAGLEQKFAVAMLNAPIATNEQIIADGRLHRFHGVGDKRDSKNGAYILHNDVHPAGWFKHYSTGIEGKWSLSGTCEWLSSSMRGRVAAEWESRQAELQRLHASVAKKAQSIWSSATRLLRLAQHPYLLKKGIQPNTARIINCGSGGRLIIPYIQRGSQNYKPAVYWCAWEKALLSGGKKKGCFSVIGKPAAGEPILVCEGWATGCSLHKDTGKFVGVAMDAGNLQPVARLSASDSQRIK
jgi:putative DNA primase/helicase